jgi:hypothetical protein
VSLKTELSTDHTGRASHIGDVIVPFETLGVAGSIPATIDYRSRKRTTDSRRASQTPCDPFIITTEKKEEENGKRPADKHNHQIPVDVQVHSATRRDKDLSDFHTNMKMKNLGAYLSSEIIFV